jgi:hypothetical protein
MLPPDKKQVKRLAELRLQSKLIIAEVKEGKMDKASAADKILAIHEEIESMISKSIADKEVIKKN